MLLAVFYSPCLKTRSFLLVAAPGICIL